MTSDEMERNERTVKDALSKLDPKYKPHEPDDLERLFGKADSMVALVRDQLKPIVVAETTTGKIHTPEGRAAFVKTAVKLLLNQFTKEHLNRDEALFLLAFTHARLLLEEVA